MKLSRRENNLIIIALVIITIVTFLKWIIIPFWNNYRATDYLIEQQERILSKAKKRVKDFNQEEIELFQARSDLENIYKLIYKNEDGQTQVVLLRTIEKYIKESKLNLLTKTLVTEKIPDKKHLTKIICKISAKGNWQQLIIFLDLINQNKKALMVDRLEIRKSSDTELKLDLHIQVINMEGAK